MRLSILIICIVYCLSGCMTQSESQYINHIASSGPMGIPVKEVNAYGRVISVNPTTRVIQIKHAPIPELNWAPMLMNFTVTDNISLASFDKGDVVAFILELDRDNNYRISALSQK